MPSSTSDRPGSSSLLRRPRSAASSTRPPSACPPSRSRPSSSSTLTRPQSTRHQTAYSSRLSTSRPATTASGAVDGGEYIVAALQSKSSNGVEVGLAAINVDTGRMTITQIADSVAFTKTLHYLSLYSPSTVLLTDTQVSDTSVPRQTDAKMVEKIKGELPVKCQPVARACWNPDNGVDLINRFCIDDGTKASVLLVSADRYYALCAASALLDYVCVKHGANLADNSIIIKYEAMKDYMFIDPESARNLELVQNNVTMKQNNCLFSTLNACQTPMGERLLRASILQPLNHKQLVENRLDAVEELINSPGMLYAVRKSIKPLNNVDFDKLISKISQNVNPVADASQTETRIILLLQLRTVVTAVPELAHTLSTCNAALLKLLNENLSSDALHEIATMIDERINDDATLNAGGKGQKRQMAKNARLYAVKSSFNRLLDVARSTYQENVDDIRKLPGEHDEEYGIHPSLEWTEQGFRFSCRVEDIEGVAFPKEFINVERKKNVIQFSSQELLKRNQRMLQTQQEVYVMSEDIVSELVRDVVEKIGCLYSSSEAIAVVDLLSGFAHISSSQSCVRPQFNRTLAIKNGRHPILQRTLPTGTCVPNDIYAADGPANFQLVQGPNMSGKSSYLRQIGLMTVQAMIGCFVPAEYAQFKLFDALLTRLSNDDCMEKSLSTFAAEMATSAMILDLATSRSLVLVDELGRGTAPIEGVGLAQAIAEALIKKKSFTYFATHFQELPQTLCTYLGVVTLHLQVQTNSHMGATSEFSSTFHYKVLEGSCKEQHYGLELAKMASLPAEVTDKAWEVATKLTDLEEKGKYRYHRRNASLANVQAMRRKAIIELPGKLRQLLDSTTGSSARGDLDNTPANVVYLRKLQDDLLEALQSVLEMEESSTSGGAGGSTVAQPSV